MKLQYTHSEAIDRLHQINGRMEQLAAQERRSAAQEAEFEELSEQFSVVDKHRQSLERRHQLARGGGSGYRVEAGSIQPYGDPDDDHPLRGVRDRAMRQLDRSIKNGLPAEGAEVCEQLIGTGPDPERSWTARWVTETGSPDYRSAFAKLLLHGEQRAGLEFSSAERDAFDRVTRLKTEQRAMGGQTDVAGGYLVPFELDPNVVLTSSGSINPLLSISRVISTVSDVWHGVSSAGVVAEWLGEAAEASDASPTLQEPTIPNYKMSVFVPFSVELQGDAVGLMGELGRLLQDGASQLLNTALTTGSGIGQPTGIISALAGTASQVNTATTDTLVAGDVYNLQNQLPPRFSGNAQFCANLGVLNSLRQLETTNGALRFPELRDNPPHLLGRNANELSNMASGITVGQHSKILLYGDFDHYVVSRRIGSSIELIQHLVGSNRRPTGQRGVWLWSRQGADVVVPNAFRLLAA